MSALLLALLVVAVTFGCDSAPAEVPAEPLEPLPAVEANAPAEVPPKVPDPPPSEVAPAPGSDPSYERPRRPAVPTLAELLPTLGDDEEDELRPTTRPETLADAITEGYEDVADVRSAVAIDDTGAFIILVADGEESGHTVVSLLRHDGRRERRILGFRAWGEPVPALRRRLRRYGALATLPNLIGSAAYWEFSLDTYAPLVALSGPLDGWVIWDETTDIGDREQRLHLMRADGSEDRVLETRPAALGSCEPGRWCDVNDVDQDAECTDAMLEAEGDLCTHPSSIHEVVLGPGGKLIVRGLIVHPGHDGYSISRWVVDLPEGVLP